jgi:hypothetical protein
MEVSLTLSQCVVQRISRDLTSPSVSMLPLSAQPVLASLRAAHANAEALVQCIPTSCVHVWSPSFLIQPPLYTVRTPTR